MTSNFIKKLIPMSLYSNLRYLKRKLSARKELQTWQNSGKKSATPHLIKQQAILAVKNTYHVDTLVETGTYFGDMVYAQLNHFKKIYSIELDDKLYQFAHKTFKKHGNVNILHGDSGIILTEVVPLLPERALFWLDGHYSGGVTAKSDKNCPIYQELTAIFSDNKAHLLLIDDADSFVGSNDYPTLEALTDFIKRHNPHYRIHVQNNIIHVLS